MFVRNKSRPLRPFTRANMCNPPMTYASIRESSNSFEVDDVGHALLSSSRTSLSRPLHIIRLESGCLAMPAPGDIRLLQGSNPGHDARGSTRMCKLSRHPGALVSCLIRVPSTHFTHGIIWEYPPAVLPRGLKLNTPTQFVRRGMVLSISKLLGSVGGALTVIRHQSNGGGAATLHLA